MGKIRCKPVAILANRLRFTSLLSNYLMLIPRPRGTKCAGIIDNPVPQRQHIHQHTFTQRGQRVVNMGMRVFLLVIVAADKAIMRQLAQCAGQHPLGDTR